MGYDYINIMVIIIYGDNLKYQLLLVFELHKKNKAGFL